jgi:predicted nucleotidyltransferase
MKKNNKDYLFSSLHLFLRNLISGDSCINFEVLHTDSIKNSSLSFLHQNREEFYNYNIAKAYLGFAKRDLKNIIHENNFINYKKLSHVVRSVTTCEAILNKNYDNHFSHYQQEYNLMKSLKDQKTNNAHDLIKLYEEKTTTLRNQINNLLENKKIVRALKVDFMASLDIWLEDLVNSNDYIQKRNHLTIDKTLYYKVLEEGLKYS